jgi:hypothetical protein
MLEEKGNAQTAAEIMADLSKFLKPCDVGCDNQNSTAHYAKKGKITQHMTT